MPKPTLNQMVARIAREEINAVIAMAGLTRLRKLTDTIIFPDGKPYTLADLICRRLDPRRRFARPIVTEARKRLGARS